MAFGFAGAAAGASKSLEDIVAQRILEQKLEAEIADRQQRASMEQQQFDQRTKEFGIESGQRQQQIDMQAGDRRARENDKGVRRMISESLMQGGTPDRKALAALQIEAGDAPTMLNEPPSPKRGTHVVGGNLVDDEGRVLFKAPPSSQGDEKKPMVVKMPDGTIRDLNGVLPDGAVPYDPVAARSAQPDNSKQAEAMQQYRNDMLDVISGLLDDNGNLKPSAAGVVGALEGRVPEGMYFDEGKQHALASINRLQGLLDLKTLGDLKQQSRTGASGFGALSEKELAVLEGAASTLRNRRQGDITYASELGRIRNELMRGRNGATNSGIAVDASGLPGDPDAAAMALIEKARAARKKP